MKHLFLVGIYTTFALQQVSPVIAAQPTASRDSGTIEGRVIYKTDPKRKWRYARYYIKDGKLGYLAESVVGLTSTSLRKYQSKQQAKIVQMDQRNFRFVPETIAIRTGDTVEFHNNDRSVHNVRAGNTLEPFSVNIANGKTLKKVFNDRSGIQRPVKIGCVFHSAMQAWIFVFPHPFFTVTKSDGIFRLKDVPAGKYRLEMAHPGGALMWSKSITVSAGQTLKLDITVSPDNLKK